MLVTENQNRPAVDQLYYHTLTSLFIHKCNVGSAKCQTFFSRARARSGPSQPGNQTCRKTACKAKKQFDHTSVEHDLLPPIVRNQKFRADGWSSKAQTRQKALKPGFPFSKWTTNLIKMREKP